MQQAEERARDPRAEESQPGIAGIITDRSAGERTDRHHPFDTDVDHTALFRKTGAERGIEQQPALRRPPALVLRKALVPPVGGESQDIHQNQI